MNNKILIEVFVPMIEQEFDVFIPINKKIVNVIRLLYEAIKDLSNDCLPDKKNIILYNRQNGFVIDPKLSVKEAGLVNGTQVILI